MLSKDWKCVCAPCHVWEIANCVCCLLSAALYYAVTLPCLFRFDCYKLKWMANLLSVFKLGRVSGSNESFLLFVATWLQCYGIKSVLMAKKKMIWNILAGEKWFNLQAASNNTSYLVQIVWSKISFVKRIIIRSSVWLWMCPSLNCRVLFLWALVASLVPIHKMDYALPFNSVAVWEKVYLCLFIVSWLIMLTMEIQQPISIL